MSQTNANPSASSAPATSASSPRPASPSWAATSTASTSTPTRSRACKAGEIPIYEPGLAELVADNRERLHFSTDIADALEHARLLFVAVGTPPTYSGDADLSAVHAVVDAMPASDRHALVMKSTVPVGTGASIKRVLRRGGQARASATSRARSSSRRARRSRTSCTPTASSSATTATGPATPSSSSTRRSTRRSCAPTSPRPRWSSSPPTRSWPRRSRSSTRSPTSARRPAPTSSRSRGGWASTTASARSSCRPGIGFGGSLLSQGRQRAQAARRQLRLPLPAAQRGHRGQRAAEAARHRQAAEAPRLARRQDASRCSGWRSSRTPTTCARRPRSCSARGCRPTGAKVARLRPGRRGGGAQAHPRRALRRATRWTRSRGADAVVLVTEWDEFLHARLGAGRRGDGRHARPRRAQRARRRRRRAPPG